MAHFTCFRIKLTRRCPLRLLTVDYKRARVFASKQCLAIFQRHLKEFLRIYVTVDKTSTHYYTSVKKMKTLKMKTVPSAGHGSGHFFRIHI